MKYIVETFRLPFPACEPGYGVMPAEDWDSDCSSPGMTSLWEVEADDEEGAVARLIEHGAGKGKRVRRLL